MSEERSAGSKPTMDYQAFEHQAEKTAKTIKEHDFDKMGYDAGVVGIYANAYAKGSLPAPAGITKEKASQVINNQFQKLYGKTPSEYSNERGVRLTTAAGRISQDQNRTVARHRLSKSKNNEQDRGR